MQQLRSLWLSRQIAFAFILSWFFMAEQQLLAQVVLDRLVVEVDKRGYTQRFIEVYLAVKQILSGSGELSWKPLTAEQWPSQIEEFLRDAVINHEAQRLNTFKPSGRTLDMAEQIIIQTKNSQGALAAYFNLLKTDKATLREALALFYRVKGFIRIRTQKTYSEEVPLIGFIPIPADADWFKSIERRSSFRTFDDVRTYRPLQAF